MTEVSFLDNQEVSEDMINSVFADLGSTTVLKKPVDGFYHIDMLNDITADLVTSGVLNYGSKCAVTTDKDITKAIIANGIIVFDSGVKLKITGTEDVPLIKGKKNYIYAIHRDANNEAALEASDTGFPATAVKLAEIGTDGKVVDKRVYSKTKVVLTLEKIPFEYTIPDFSFTYPSTTTKEIVIDTNGALYNHIMTIENFMGLNNLYIGGSYNIYLKKYYSNYTDYFYLTEVNKGSHNRVAVKIIEIMLLENNNVKIKIEPLYIKQESVLNFDISGVKLLLL